MCVRRLLAVAGALLLLAGCSSSPTKPVASVPLSSLDLIPAFDTLFVGSQFTFTVSAVDTHGVAVANPVLAWSSGNTAVFPVSSSGTLTGVGGGPRGAFASPG